MSLKTIGTITTAISVGVGLLGLGLYFVGKGAIEDRDDLLRGAASPENTSAIVAKHSQAESMYMGAWISLSVAGVGMSLGAILFSIGRRTDHLNYNAKAPAPRRSRRVTLLSTGVFP